MQQNEEDIVGMTVQAGVNKKKKKWTIFYISYVPMNELLSLYI